MDYRGSDIARKSDGLSAFSNSLKAALASSTSNSTTTLASVGLAVTLAPGATYLIKGVVIFQAAATTTGLTLGFAFTDIAAGGVSIIVPKIAAAANSALEQTFNSTGSLTGAGVSAVATNHFALIDGIITIAATGGSFALQFASSAAGSVVTIQAGSLLVAERLL